MKKLAAFILIVIAFTACRKKTPGPTPANDPVPQRTTRELLLDGIWRVSDRRTVVRDSSGTIVSSSDLSTMDLCEKDGFSTFRSDGKLLIDDGPLKCEPTDPQVDSSHTWELSQDEDELALLIGFSVVVRYRILSISATTAKIATHYPVSITEMIDDTTTFTNIK